MDDEIKGEGNSVNFTFRMHDPRLGRFFAIDPLAGKYPHNSPYAFSENKVIHCIELEGLESIAVFVVNTGEDGKEQTPIHTPRADYVNNELEVNLRKYIHKDGDGNTWRISYQVVLPSGQGGSTVSYDNQAQAAADYSNWLAFFNSSISKSTKHVPSMSKEQSAEGLENSLNAYASEEYANGNYLTGLYYSVQALSSGFEGETGLYRKGIPTMAATVSTVFTFGSGSLFSGAVSSGIANGSGNLIGQWAQTGSVYKVDGWSVGLATFGGAIKNPWLSTALTSSADAALDVKFDGSINVVGTSEKSWSQGLMDLGFGLGGGTQSNLLQKSGISQKTLNIRAIIIGGMQQYSNGVANDKLTQP